MMRVRVWVHDECDSEYEIEVEASGRYSPDVLRDVTNRAGEALERAREGVEWLDDGMPDEPDDEDATD